MSDTDSPSRPALVLLVNDQEWAARSLESVLGPNGYAVLRAFTGRQGIDMARSTQPDLIIVDVHLPDMAGVAVCEALRSPARTGATTPVIMTSSGAADRTERIAAYQAGVWELFGYPLDVEVLLAKMATFVRAKRESDALRDECLLDGLTGLYNMRGLARRAREIGAQAQRTHSALSCVALSPEPEAVDGQRDLDDDSAAALAAQLAALMRQSSRSSDAVGRMGQSEFAIIAPATTAEGALRMVERLRNRVEAGSFTIGGLERRLRLRAGYCAVADFADSSVDGEEILLRATVALHHAPTDTPDSRVRAFDAVAVRPLS
ncbi:MAG TPA: response regulator [Gemmatimonadaceae bacterium]|nr:response regulator [Gemmatimonadaceae bacterium]